MRTNMREMKRRQMASGAGPMGKRTRKGGSNPDGGEGPPGMPDDFDDRTVHVDQGDGMLVPSGRFELDDGPGYSLPDTAPPGWGES